MDDRQARTVDTVIKVVGVLLAVAGFWDGIRRYNDGRIAEARSSAERARQAALVTLRESRKPFLERQLTLYFEATKAAAQLSTLSRGAAWTAARQRFWELYWGELGLVEDAGFPAHSGNSGGRFARPGRPGVTPVRHRSANWPTGNAVPQ